ncbi:MAG: transposase [Deltaproteobacteria bacterium]|nr:transposase [Deltaproteobacteria bacterium]MBI3294749.1 transposase [Deltaproteobacteria bacterium]
MPRKPLIVSTRFCYHITNRSNNKEWFYLPPEETWQIFCRVLGRCSDLYQVEIRSFVLMSNHYHLIARTPLGDPGEVVRYLQTEVARAIQKKSGRINHIFGGRYKWSLLWNESAFAFAYKYVARNPIAAGLCSRVEDWPLSILFYQHWKRPLDIAVSDEYGPHEIFIPRVWSERLEWLNRPSPKELDVLIRKALRRYAFAFSLGNDCRKAVEQVSATYGIPLPVPATYSA